MDQRVQSAEQQEGVPRIHHDAGGHVRTEGHIGSAAIWRPSRKMVVQVTAAAVWCMAMTSAFIGFAEYNVEIRRVLERLADNDSKGATRPGAANEVAMTTAEGHRWDAPEPPSVSGSAGTKAKLENAPAYDFSVGMAEGPVPAPASGAIDQDRSTATNATAAAVSGASDTGAMAEPNRSEPVLAGAASPPPMAGQAPTRSAKKSGPGVTRRVARGRQLKNSRRQRSHFDARYRPDGPVGLAAGLRGPHPYSYFYPRYRTYESLEPATGLRGPNPYSPKGGN